MIKTKTYLLILISLCALASIFLAISTITPVQAANKYIQNHIISDKPQKSRLISPIPKKILGLNPKKVSLGKQLFTDTRLSQSGFSCTTCHSLSHYGIDQLETPVTTMKTRGIWNTPSIFNLVFQDSYMWNGRLNTLEEQILDVMSNKAHMNGNWKSTVHQLSNDANLKSQFTSIYKNGITQSNIIDALVNFEKSLITPNAPFDRYLQGDDNAISDDQKSGFILFNEYGCIACHQGTNIGGGLRAKLGIFVSPFDSDNILERDLGLEAVTKNIKDRHIFRVASLRNVAKTAPYFHHGQVKSLESAVKKMAKYQLNRDIPDADTKLIVAFLQSLTGELPQ